MTRSATRFPSPVSSNRAREVRRADVYSPKLKRRLQCFGEAVYHQWLRLEADPSVHAYCERPGYLDLEDRRVLADFWVRQTGQESLLIVGDKNYPFRAFVGSNEFEVRSVPHAELSAARIWIGDWERILPVIIACRDLVPASLLRSVQRFACAQTPLARFLAFSGNAAFEQPLLTLLQKVLKAGLP